MKIFIIVFCIMFLGVFGLNADTLVTFNGPGPNVGTLYDSSTGQTVYAGPYDLTVNGQHFLIPCITPQFEVYDGETWQANVVPLTLNGLTIFAGQTTFFLSGQVMSEQAWLTSQMGTDPTINTSLQGAIWDLTIPGSFTDAGSLATLVSANSWYHSLSSTEITAFDANYNLVVPVYNSQSIGAFPQLFMDAPAAVPEPASIFLIGTALLMIGSIMRKKLVMKTLIITLLLAVGTCSTAFGQTYTRTGVFSHIAAGGAWTTEITLVNTSESRTLPVIVYFYGDSGEPLTFPIKTTYQGISILTHHYVDLWMSPNTTLCISLEDPSSPTTVGWADVLGTTGDIDGYAIFRSTSTTKLPSQEGTVAFQSQTNFLKSVTLPYDNSNGFVMGVALANLSTSFVPVTVTIWDENGTKLGTQSLSIPANAHTSFILPDQFPLTKGFRGIVKFKSSGDLTGIGLRFSPFGTFTSVPTR